MNVTAEEIQSYSLPTFIDLNDINLIDFASNNGYHLYKDKNNKSKISAASSVLESNIYNDKLLVYKDGYKNTNEDPTDKGKIYQFISNRIDISDPNNIIKSSESFKKRAILYVAAKYLSLGNIKQIVNHKEKDYVKKPKTFESITDLKKNFNLKILHKKIFLKSRSISSKTINNVLFKNHIFNSMGKAAPNLEPTIPNIAFPLYHPIDENKVTGFSFRNNNWKKIVGNHNHLWHSKYIDKPQNILISESALDAISHYQINPNNKSIYFSFSGNLYDSKIKNLLTSIKLLNKKDNNLNIVSITDNDISGFKYDLEIYTALVNEYNKNINIEFDKFNFQLKIHSNTIDTNQDWKLFINTVDLINKEVKETINITTTNDIFYIKIDKNINSKQFQNILENLNNVYLKNINFKIQKSVHGDWNEDLMLNSKKKTNKLKL